MLINCQPYHRNDAQKSLACGLYPLLLKILCMDGAFHFILVVSVTWDHIENHISLSYFNLSYILNSCQLISSGQIRGKCKSSYN